VGGWVSWEILKKILISFFFVAGVPEVSAFRRVLTLGTPRSLGVALHCRICHPGLWNGQAPGHYVRRQASSAKRE
jgi:hypothetical protein